MPIQKSLHSINCMLNLTPNRLRFVFKEKLDISILLIYNRITFFSHGIQTKLTLFLNEHQTTKYNRVDGYEKDHKESYTQE